MGDTNHSVDEYINKFPQDVRERLQTIRDIIKKILPEAQERMSYKMPAYYQNGYIIYFAGYTHHVAMYPIFPDTPSFRSLIEPYMSGKATVRFPNTHPLPLSVIQAIVKHKREKSIEKK